MSLKIHGSRCRTKREKEREVTLNLAVTYQEGLKFKQSVLDYLRLNFSLLS